MGQITEELLAPGCKALDQMKPGDVGWIYPQNLMVDCDGEMFVHERVSVFNHRSPKTNTLVLNKYDSDFQTSALNVKIEKLPDGLFVVNLNYSNYKWSKIPEKYTTWKDIIIVSLVEQC